MILICDPPQDFNAIGESTRTTRFHFKTKEFILTRFSTLAILPRLSDARKYKIISD